MLELDQIQMKILGLLEDHRGLKAEFQDSRFTLTYMASGLVRHYHVSLLPSKYTGRDQWYKEVIPRMNALAESLEMFANALNERFLNEYAELMREM